MHTRSESQLSHLLAYLYLIVYRSMLVFCLKCQMIIFRAYRLLKRLTDSLVGNIWQAAVTFITFLARSKRLFSKIKSFQNQLDVELSFALNSARVFASTVRHRSNATPDPTARMSGEQSSAQNGALSPAHRASASRANNQKRRLVPAANSRLLLAEASAPHSQLSPSPLLPCARSREM